MTDQAIPFRAATPAPAAASTTSGSSASAQTSQMAKSNMDDAPPSLYNEVNKKPYAVKHLDLELYHDDDSFAEVKDQAKALDEYVLKQIKAQGLKDEPGSYKEVIDALYKQIGKSANEDPTKALKRLTTAAGAIARLNEAKLQPILSAKTLTPTEYEEIQA
jgi:predicted RNA-binding Zn ribbon-like protein